MNRHAIALASFVAAAILWLAPTARAAGILAPVEPGVPPLALRQHTVHVTIDHQVAKTRVTQVFHNSLPRQLEANYLFPVPKGAQVTDFVLYINGKPVPAEIMEKDQARHIYEDIVRRMRDPGLLEYLDRDLFRVRVFPVPASGDQRLEIEFMQPLTLDGGAAQYVYPLGPLARPEAGAGGFQFDFSIRSDTPIKTVYSPSHRLDLRREGEKTVDGSILPRDVDYGRDVTLVYTVSKDEIGLSALAFRPDASQPGYFMVMIAPQVHVEERDIQPKAVTFVLDTSGSMSSGGKIEQARSALKRCLDNLRTKDQFNIVRFATDVDSFRSEMVPASDANVNQARKWVDGFRAAGGTDIDDALAAALAAKPPRGFVHTILLLTDGRPTVGETNPASILDNVRQRNEGGLRIFAFGVGFDVNTLFLDQLAEDSRAVSQYVRPNEDIEVAVSSLFDKIASPVLTGLELDVRGVRTVDVFPRKLPDLFLGSQLIVFGRYKNPGKADVVLTGDLSGKQQKFEYQAQFPRKNDRFGYIEPLWGNRKVGYLLDEIRRNGEDPEVVQEVVALAKRYGIVTPYTSYLVTDDMESPQMLALPPIAGSSFYMSAPRPTSAAPSTANSRARHYGAALAPTPASEAAALSYRFQSDAIVPGAAGPAAGAPRIAGSAGRTAGRPESLAIAPENRARPLMRTENKAAAVETSEELRKLKDSSVVQSGEAASERTVSGRVFIKKKNIWEDQTIRGRDSVLSVKFLSEAYFELTRLRPDLKEALSLGEQMEIRLDDKTVLRVSDQGKEKLTEADRKLLEKTRPATE